MSKHIPIYPLNNLTDHAGNSLDLLLLGLPVSEPRAALDVPHRTNYYGVGICVSGEASVSANLENYTISQRDLLVLSPHIVKQWHSKSPDFETLAILFTADFICAGNPSALHPFSFFDRIATSVIPLEAVSWERLSGALRYIHQRYQDGGLYRNEILRSLINALLYEVSAVYEKYDLDKTSVQTRAQALAADFKKLVKEHFLTQRGVRFYSDGLFVSVRHLTETVRLVTGRTPGEWIAEAVVLEARLLLQDPALSVAQVADVLHFNDQSSFGKYFKNIAGVSPAAYRQGER